MSHRSNTAASVRARLLNRARSERTDFNLLLTRFALERLLYRLSLSPHSERFLLKGALLFDLWFDVPRRPTRDADFLGFGEADVEALRSIFSEICSIEVEEDGIRFHPDSVKAIEIREEANYPGVRVTLVGSLDGARCPVQIDVGFGDTVTPAAEEAHYPVLLDTLPNPVLRAYPVYTVVAEKFQALTMLGIANSRMKDYFDLWVIRQELSLDGELLRKAISATFSRRQTEIPTEPPFGLSTAFADDAQKRGQWRAFLNKNQLDAPPLSKIVEHLSDFLIPAARAAAIGEQMRSTWTAGSAWQ